MFLAVVLDVFSRRVVGWAIATHLRTGSGATRKPLHLLVCVDLFPSADEFGLLPAPFARHYR